MKKQYTFQCGCKFDILAEDPLRVAFDPTIENLNLQCERTWDYISNGNTKGVFQLESRLGQSLAKKLAPHNIEELAALVSLMRPGGMEAIVDGKSLTQHYIDRKHGREEVTYLHQALEPILNKTYGILTYQEQSMQIAQIIGGFNLQEADMLRKAIGKKKPEEMAKVKTMFLEGAAKMGIVSKEYAEEIFSWIEKSQRYSFNKSHAVSYAINGYLSAFTKAHFTRPFFASYLYWSPGKLHPFDEVRELVNNAKSMDIEVRGPDISDSTTPIEFRNNFYLKDRVIYFGLSNIKGVGESVLLTMIPLLKEMEKVKKIDQYSWFEILTILLARVKSDAARAMISAGVFSYLNIPRTRILYEYDLYARLNDRELGMVKAAGLTTANLQQILEYLLSLPPGKNGIANKKRYEIIQGLLMNLKSPPYALQDRPDWIAGVEESLLGIPITCSKVDSCDVGAANTTCKEFQDGKGGNMIIATIVNKVAEVKTKKGKNPGELMAFLVVSDQSCALDNVVVWPKSWKELRGLLVEGNTVLLSGDKNKDGSFVVEKAWQI